MTITDLTNVPTNGASFRTILDCNTLLAENPCVPGTAWILALDVTHGNDTVYAVPLPAALPLFLSALAGLGLMGWGCQGGAKCSIHVHSDLPPKRRRYGT